MGDSGGEISSTASTFSLASLHYRSSKVTFPVFGLIQAGIIKLCMYIISPFASFFFYLFLFLVLIPNSLLPGINLP